MRRRGEYLAKAADCTACHTVPEAGKPFAGGVAFKLPFGTIYSTNITPDPEYGIGGWSDDEFVRAVRDGVGRHGEHLYPAFPYTSYTQLSRGDVLAIKAYLMSLRRFRGRIGPTISAFRSISAGRLDSGMRLVLQETSALRPMHQSRRFGTAAPISPTALGHCAECHTPRNSAFGLERGRDLEGAELQGWRAYNITSDPKFGIGSWSDAELTRYLQTGRRRGTRPPADPWVKRLRTACNSWMTATSPRWWRICARCRHARARIRSMSTVRAPHQSWRRRIRCPDPASATAHRTVSGCSKALAPAVINGTARAS